MLDVHQVPFSSPWWCSYQKGFVFAVSDATFGSRGAAEKQASSFGIFTHFEAHMIKAATPCHVSPAYPPSRMST